METSPKVNFVILLLIAQLVYGSVPSNQLNALEDLYYSTNGINWTTNKNWLVGDPCTNLWYGITCSSGQLQYLTLRSNNLSGTLPTSFNQLNIAQINLENNEITGNLPVLPATSLILDFNLISGTIPVLPESMPGLYLSGNMLTGTIPSLPSALSGLYLSGNMLTGTIPSLPSSLSGLDLSNNKLTGTIPILPLTLTEMNLSHNNLSGTLPPTIYSAPKLSKLSLSHNSFSGSIGGFPYIYELDLSSNLFSGNLPTVISNYPYYDQFYLLNVSRNQLTGTIPTFSPLRIENLDLSHNSFTGSIPNIYNWGFYILSHNQLSGTIPPYAFQSEMFYADLSHNQLTGTLPQTLSNSTLSNFMYLYLGHNSLSGTIPASMFYIEDLSFISLSHNSFTGTIPNPNPNNLKDPIQLYQFDVSNNQLTGPLPSYDNLITANFANNSLEGSIPSTYYSYSDLRSLYMENNNITGFIDVEKFQNLSSYNFTNNQFYCPVSYECGEFGNQLCLPCKSTTLSLLETLSTAVLFFIDGNTENATALVKHACDSVLTNDIFATSGLQNISCQWYNNLANGNNFFGRRENTITKLSWQYYNDLVNDQVQRVLVPYENLIAEFKENIHNTQTLQTLTQSVINYANQETSYWETVVNNATTLLTTEEQLILYFRDELNQILLVDITNDLSTLQTDIANQIQKINDEINTIQRQTFFSDMLDIGEVLVGSALALLGLPTEEFVVFNTIQLIGDYFDTLSAADQVAALQESVEQLQGISNDLENAKNSLYSVADFYNDISTDEPLPVILPALYLNLITIDSIDQSVDQLAERLIQINDVNELREDVDDLTAITKQFTQAVVNWYLVEMKIQSYQSQLAISESAAQSLTYLLDNEEQEEEGYLAAFFTAFQFKTAATFRILIDMLYLQNQYNYYALSDFSFRPYLPFNPTSQDISTAQLKLYNTIISYVNNAQLPSQITANYTLTADRNNNTFTSLWTTGSAYFVISLPDANLWKEKGYGYYYAVNMISLRAYPSPIVNPRFSTLNIGLTQLGDNLFYDQNAKNWNFTTTIYDYTFIFDSNSLCAVSSQYDPQNIDYIHYSPYGIWQINIPKNQMDITQITKIELQFTLYLNTNTHQHIPLWGNYPYGDILIVPPSC